MLRRFTSSTPQLSSSFSSIILRRSSRSLLTNTSSCSSSTNTTQRKSCSSSSQESTPPTAGQTLQRVALEQLQKELQRDIQENSSANQPLPPKGWHLTRTPGTCTFKLTSVCQFSNGKSSAMMNSKNHHGDTTKMKQEFSPTATKKKKNFSSLFGGSSSGSWCAKVEVFCRFETMDPSFWEPTVGICEYVPFRVVVERVAPGGSVLVGSSSSSSSRNSNNHSKNYFPEEQEGVDNFSSSSSSSSTSTIHSNLMIIDCAHVQSQLRIRRLFFAPTTDREALEDEAAVGMTHGVYCGPELSHAPLLSTSSSSTSSTSKSVSKELYQSVMELLSSCGIDNRLGEYICQSAYCFEHEEYEIWLAKLAEFGGRSYREKSDDDEDDQGDDEQVNNNNNRRMMSNSKNSTTADRSTTEQVAKDILRDEYSSKKNYKGNNRDNTKSIVSDFDDLTETERDLEMRKVAEKMSDVLGKVKTHDGHHSAIGDVDSSSSSSLSPNSNNSSGGSSISSLTGKPRRRGGSSIVRNRY